jgi:hypothetical protein
MLGNSLLVEVLVEVFVRPVATFPKHLVALNDVFEPKGHVALASSVQDDLILHSEFSIKEPAMDGWCSSFGHFLFLEIIKKEYPILQT